MAKKIKAYFMRVDKESGKPFKGYMGEIEDTLEAEQLYVGFGRKKYIDVLAITDEIDIVFSDEGKLLKYPLNRAVVREGRVSDIIAGNILCVRHDNEGAFTSILESDIEVIEKILQPILFVAGNVVSTINSDFLPEWSEEISDEEE